jgi:hypothetical protein
MNRETSCPPGVSTPTAGDLHPAVSDAELEAEITAAYQATVRAPTEELQRASFSIMARLIERRSAGQVARMERAQGLR